MRLGEWLVTKAFYNLTTYYDKASSAVAGIMDLPLFQIHGPEQSWKDLFANLGSNNTTGYSWDGYNHQLRYNSGFASVLSPSLLNLVTDTVDGVSYHSVCEVVVPAKPYDIALRIGRTPTGELVLTAHVVSDYGSWSKLSDKEHNSKIYESLMAALKFVSQLCPIVDGRQSVDDTSIRWHDVTNIFLKYGSLETEELATCLALGTKSVQDVVSSLGVQGSLLIAGLVAYVCLMSKGFVTANGANCTNDTMNHYLFFTTNLYTLSADEATFIAALEDTSIDLQRFNSHTFRPYSKTNQLPVTIHYQTMTERGREIINAVLMTVIAAAAVVATVKLTRWRKKRQKDTLLAHASVDKLSWDVASDPSPKNMDLFTKAWKKARKMDFVNGILGIATGSGSDAMSSAIGTITNILGKGTKDAESSAAISSQVLSSTGGIDQEVKAVRDLITG